MSTRGNTGFHAWIDTLAPSEPDFPGALALGVAEKIEAAIARNPQYAALINTAMQWIEARARDARSTSFAKLSGLDRQKIVAAAAASNVGSVPRTFFQASLDDTLFHTYADPRAWVGLHYAGPPQPIGFLDHAIAPKAT
jgi:Gluconate 2-dehydrogenase subunit 3